MFGELIYGLLVYLVVRPHFGGWYLSGDAKRALSAW